MQIDFFSVVIKEMCAIKTRETALNMDASCLFWDGLRSSGAQPSLHCCFLSPTDPVKVLTGKIKDVAGQSRTPFLLLPAATDQAL